MSNVIPFNSNKNQKNIHANVYASFNSEVRIPEIKSTAYVHSLAAVIGNVYLGERVMVAPAASVRGDEGQPIWVGNDVNIQDCVVLHALETEHHDVLVEEAVVEVDGNYYGVYIDERVSLAHQCQVHGPASIGADTFVGMQSLVFRATVGKNCVIEPKALVMGVNVADGRYVPAGALITTQAAANQLPFVNYSDHFKNLSKLVAEVDTESATVYPEEMQQRLRIA
jgi:carbonic anhydrase